MRKLTLILLSILLVTALFVSCKVEMSESENDAVYVRFNIDDSSRALTATKTKLDATKYAWYYSAEKVKDGGPAYGATTEETLIKAASTAALSTVKVGPFSPGEWIFTLYGYFSTDTNKVLVYKGTVSTSFKQDKRINVVVEPQKTEGGTGTLVISKNVNFTAEKTYTPNYIKIMNGIGSSLSPYKHGGDTGTNYGIGQELNISSNDFTLENVPSGSYTIQLYYNQDDTTGYSTYTYAVNTIVVNVWNNLTTTISGNLDPKTYYTTFDVDEAGGVVFTENNIITKNASNSQTSNFKFTPYYNTYNTEITSLRNTEQNTAVVFTYSTKNEETITLKTYDATACQTYFYDYYNSVNGEFVGAYELSSSVKLSNISVVSYLESGLEDVKVYSISGDTATALTSSSQYAYTSADGKIELKSVALGQYVVTAKSLVSVGGDSYTTLGTAISKATTGSTIKLNKNITQNCSLTIVSGKNLTLDLGNYTMTATYNTSGSSALFDVEGELTIKNGTIKVTKNSSSTNYANCFYVKNGGSTAKLTIENGTYTADGAVITGSGSDGGSNTSTADATSITISGGTFTSTTGTAIYHPQNGKLTISGGTFTGGASGSAVEIRAGQATISGGTFNSSAVYSVAKNGSGTTVTGAALAVSQHSTECAKSMSVTIDAGTFSSTGTNGKQVAFVYTCDDSSTNSAKLKIKTNVSLTSIIGTAGSDSDGYKSYTAVAIEQ